MGYDPARVALALLAVGVVAVSATLFPAAGLGSYPAADRTGGVPGSTGEVGVGGTTPASATTPTATPTPSSGADGGTATPTDTPTPTATPTPDPAANYDTGGGGFGGVVGPIFGILCVLLVGAVGGVLVLSGRYAANAGELPEGRLPRVRIAVRAVPQVTMAVLVGAGSTAATAAGTLGSVVGTVGGSVAAGTGSILGGFGRALAAVPTALAALSLPSLSLSGLFSGIGSPPGSTGRRPSGRPKTGGGASATDPEPTEPAPPETIREAWRRLRASVPGTDKESWTPGDLARRATARGYPRDAVDALTEAFRGTRYGNWAVTPERRERALDAYDRVRRALDGGPDDGDGTAGHDGGDD